MFIISAASWYRDYVACRVEGRDQGSRQSKNGARRACAKPVNVIKTKTATLMPTRIFVRQMAEAR